MTALVKMNRVNVNIKTYYANCFSKSLELTIFLDKIKMKNDTEKQNTED